MGEFAIDRTEALRALRSAADRVSATIAAIPDPSVPTTGLEWTLGQTAAHMVSNVRLHREWLRGEGTIDYGVADLAGRNIRNLATVGDQTPAALSVLLRDETAAYAAEAAAAPAATTIPAEVGPGLTVEEITSVLLGELLVHGFDLARTLRRPWPIHRDEANLVAAGTMAILPQFVNPNLPPETSASFELRLRGGPRATIRIAGGELTVRPSQGEPVDARISADPSTFILVGYDRIPQWGPILRGQLLAWGRRPWLALRFASFLRNP